MKMGKLSIEDINNVIQNGALNGHDIRMQDIMYVAALHIFKDKSVVYATLWGKDSSEDKMITYDSCDKINFLKKLIKPVSKEASKTTMKDEPDSQYEGLTFEENKDAMIKMIDELKVALDKGKMEYKEYSDRVTKLRIALNDKFAVSSKQDEQHIIVYPKFNTICPHTRTECWVQTKEFAMQHWGLIEDTNNAKLNEENNEQRDEEADK